MRRTSFLDLEKVYKNGVNLNLQRCLLNCADLGPEKLLSGDPEQLLAFFANQAGFLTTLPN